MQRRLQRVIKDILTDVQAEPNMRVKAVYQKNQSFLMDLIMFFPCCPPEAIVNVREFYENEHLNTIEESDKIFKISIRNLCSRIREWSIFDFNTYYSDSRVQPYFNSYSRSMGSVYFSVDESLIIANELLMFQCDNDGENVVNFLTDLYNVLDKKILKKNSILIKSPPSAGKNFFFDAVCSFFFNYGMYGTANKHNNFNLADGVGRRLVL